MRMFFVLLLVSSLADSVVAFQIPRQLTRPEISRQAALDSDIFLQADELWQTFPYTAAALVCGAKASAADYIAQSSQEQKDLRRNLSFIIYGSLYQGVAHEYIFNHLYPVWFGTDTGLACVVAKVTFNLLIQTTLVTLPVAYIIQAAIKEEGLDVAFDRYANDVAEKGLLLKCFALWGPVHALTFSVVPEHWRVTFVAVVSFFWLIMFSSISANDEVTEKA